MYPSVSFGLWEKKNARKAVEAAIQAESMGIEAIWLDVSRDVADPATFFAAAAWATSSLSLGLAIVPTFPRHPAVLANQAQALYQLGGTRIRLGIGPSHRHIISGAYGMSFERPLAHLREYLQILRALTTTGGCQFSGEFFTVDTGLDSAAPLPLYISALGPRAMQLAGELADGALTWLAPIDYLRDEGLAQMNAGAARAERARPRLVASFPCIVSDDIIEVRHRIGPMLSVYQALPFYASILDRAGVDLRGDEWPSVALSRIVFWGSPEQIAAQTAHALAQGIDEITLKLFSDDSASDVATLLPAITRYVIQPDSSVSTSTRGTSEGISVS